MIYFIRAIDDTGPIKIGYALDPEERKKTGQCFSPALLKTPTVIDGDRKREGAIHRHFRHLRQHGEWFSAARCQWRHRQPKVESRLRGYQSPESAWLCRG